MMIDSSNISSGYAPNNYTGFLFFFQSGINTRKRLESASAGKPINFSLIAVI